jgi:oxygen-independent coproporphyrinogen-3 oxidase
MSTWGTYIHVPWCRRRCPYCAFYVEVDRDVPWDQFVDAVLREHAFRSHEFGEQTTTLFLGGGTPSRMPGPALARLLAGIPRVAQAEVTAETNPEDADDAWIAAALEAGVTRLSLGLQTFDPQFAHLLNRACSVRDAQATAQRVAKAGFTSWSIDVMFGLPGQTLDDFQRDLDAMLETGAPHVSCYGLTIETGTPFERANVAGKLEPAEDGLWRDMYDRMVDTLLQAGIERYEVSNFARAGHRSAHNQMYWTDRPYLALGPSAHGYAPDGRRWSNVRDVARYLEALDPTAEVERPTPRQRAVDLIVSALRSVQGVDLRHLAAVTKHRLAGPTVAALVRGGHLTLARERITLTESAFPLADGVAGQLVRALEPTA